MKLVLHIILIKWLNLKSVIVHQQTLNLDQLIVYLKYKKFITRSNNNNNKIK
jgi:hypothetical protein